MSIYDQELILELISSHQIKIDCLELGAGLNTGFDIKEFLKERNLHYFASDIYNAEHIDYVADFEASFSMLDEHVFTGKRFHTILVLNVLEHTFEPIKVLQNCKSLLNSGGKLIVTTPAIFPIHNYPIDCYRLLPDFYIEFGMRNNMQLEKEYFRFLGYGQVEQFKEGNTFFFPPPHQSKAQRLKNRMVHRLFNTSGRGMRFPSHVQLSAVFTKID